MEYIDAANNWYCNKNIENFHERTTVNGAKYNMNRMGFAKTACNDDANLCEVVEITADESENANDEINQIFKRNRFDNMFRRQLEKTSAIGTCACYIVADNAEVLESGKIRNAELRLNYVDGSQYIPLTVDNDEVIEAAFASRQLVKGKRRYTIVIFCLNENKKYIAETYTVDDKGIQMDSSSLELGEIKPFSVYRTAEVNNIEEMGDGYGLPKVWDAIPVLKGLDLGYNILFNDLDKGEKLILINELLCKYGPNGEIIQSTENKKLFVLTGEKLPEENSLIHEYNPEIRIETVRNVFETLLSIVSLKFGYGSKKYTFENNHITTATEYIGGKQDQMQALNRQRYQVTQYITEIVKAVKWCSNNFNGTSYNIDSEVIIEYNDSYIIDKESVLERKRNDALSFDIPELKVWYLMDAYSLTEEEAKELVFREENDDNDEDE